MFLCLDDFICGYPSQALFRHIWPEALLICIFWPVFCPAQPMGFSGWKGAFSNKDIG
jgi:hypothetical protein